MKYVVIRSEPTGFWLDPRPYLAALPDIRGELPPGARAFAESPAHYDFSSVECVKDLQLLSVEPGPNATVTVTFAPNAWKHDRGLALTYRNVVTFTLDPEAERPGPHRSVLLDELLPSIAGFDHEIAFIEGTLRVSAGDLHAAWL